MRLQSLNQILAPRLFMGKFAYSYTREWSVWEPEMECGLGGVLGWVSVLGVSLVTAAGQPALELQTALSPGWHTPVGSRELGWHSRDRGDAWPLLCELWVLSG